VNPSDPCKPLTWLIAGAELGTALALTRAVAERGDNVVALAARHIERLGHVVDVYPEHAHAIAVDTRERQLLEQAIAQTVERFGHIDVVANMTFYDIAGAIEEVGDEATRTLFDVNVFGMLNLLRAVLPVLRAQRCGHFVQGLPCYDDICEPGAGLLAASILAMNGLIDALTQELAPLGIVVSQVDAPPAGAWTASQRAVVWMDDYESIVRSRFHAATLHSVLADVSADIAAILAKVDAEQELLRLDRARERRVTDQRSNRPAGDSGRAVVAMTRNRPAPGEPIAPNDRTDEASAPDKL
jgi:NADP-dependent 3-hydroxy acid dehydrogenase YdfG